MACKNCNEWKKLAEQCKRENDRNKEVARKLSLELERLRNGGGKEKSLPEYAEGGKGQ